MSDTHTKWFRDAGWGVFCHYLADTASTDKSSEITAEQWNMRVDAFDTERLAEQLSSAGVKYFFITIGQNSGFYCSPNATYDAITGIQPSKCSRRDLISDLYDALAFRGIRLMVYLPSGAPENDKAASLRLEWENNFNIVQTEKGVNLLRKGLRLDNFQYKWEAIIKEWSERWGEKVSGWWVDGCFFSDEMYNYPSAPNYKSLAAALKAGNPHSLVAFNPGVKIPVISVSEYEDYTAGELDGALFTGFWKDNRYSSIEAQVNGAQLHVLTFLGEWWGQGKPRFDKELVRGYTEFINKNGGVVTWDVPISEDGEIPCDFLELLPKE